MKPKPKETEPEKDINNFGRRSFVAVKGLCERVREAEKENQMRKYRGLTKDGKWVYGWYKYHPYYDIHIIQVFNELKNVDGGGVWLDYEVIPETVGQHTGLKDKNGTEIYDGDRLRTPPYKWEGYKYESKQIVVKWSAGRGESGFTLPRTGYKIGWENCEVIGNIHQNPELMEQDK